MRCKVRQSIHKALALTAAFISIAVLHAEAKLRSPWDSKHIKLTDAPYACPAVVHLSPDLTTNGFYSDSKSTIIDPEKWKAYVARSGPFKSLGDRIVGAADTYQTT